MKSFLLFLILSIELLWGGIIPIPMIESPEPIQRLTYVHTQRYLGELLFSSPYGIAGHKFSGERGGHLLFFTDDIWTRVIYTLIVDSPRGRRIRWIRAFGNWRPGSGVGEFDTPRGICIQPNLPDFLYVYIADELNNRVVRLRYNCTDSTLSWVDCIENLCHPHDVSVVVKNDGSAFLAVANHGNNTIVLFEVEQDGRVRFLSSFDGSASGRSFKHPTSVAITPCGAGSNEYYLYIADYGNCRIVCFRLRSDNSLQFVREYYRERTIFNSVAVGPYSCVYALGLGLIRRDAIYVFTPGLEELLYIYPRSFFFPKDLGIYGDEMCVTEGWTNVSGIQYFRIRPEIGELSVEPQIFDATKDSVKVSFRLDECAAYVTITIGGKEILNNRRLEPGRHSFYWDGRDKNGRLSLPGDYLGEVRAAFRHDESNPVLISSGRISVRVKGTIVSGERRGTWTEENSPYVLTGDVKIPPDATLNIQPGVKVMANGNHLLECRGVLRAEGTSENKILFTPYRKLLPTPDPTYPGAWKGIKAWGATDTCVLDNCVIEYGGGGPSDSGLVHCNTGRVRISNSVLRNSPNWGVYAGQGNHFPKVYNNTFENIPHYPLRANAKDVHTITNTSTFINTGPLMVAAGPYRKISTSSFWRRCAPGWTYEINGTLYVEKEEGVCTLRIEPGVVLKFGPYDKLKVGGGDYDRGFLLCDAGQKEPITFTSLNSCDRWDGISINNPSGAYLRNCIISYSRGNGIKYSRGRNLTLLNSQIHNCLEEGLSLSNDTSYIAYNTFADNGTGIKLKDNSATVITGNTFLRNGTAVSCYNQVPQITGNTFIQNWSYPVAIRADLVEPVLRNNIFMNNQNPGIIVRKGRISQSTHWFAPERNFSYVIDGDIDVYGDGSTAVLTIDSGITLRFDKHAELRIGGSISNNKGAIKARKVSFVNHTPYTYWGGIYFRKGTDLSQTIFKNCEIKRGGYLSANIRISQTSPLIESCKVTASKNIGIQVSAASPTIKGCWISDNECGLYIENSSSRPNITRCQIINNNWGIISESRAKPTINFCNIDNWRFGVWNRRYQRNNVTINAKDNWWGHSSGPTHPGNPQGRGDSVTDYVDYTPWLSSPISGIKGDISSGLGGNTGGRLLHPTDVVSPDEPVTPQVILKNYSLRQMTTPVELKIGGEYGAADTVTLGPLQEDTIDFPATSLSSGEKMVLLSTEGDTVSTGIEVTYGGFWEILTPPPEPKGKLVWDGDENIYLIPEGTTNLYQYNICEREWIQVSVSPVGISHATFANYSLYALGANSFYSYSPFSSDKEESWAQEDTLPEFLGEIAAIFPFTDFDTTGERIDRFYILEKGTAGKVYSYNLFSGIWEEKRPSPIGIDPFASFAFDGDDRIYLASDTNFYAYSIYDDTWYILKPIPEKAEVNSSTFGRGKVYLLKTGRFFLYRADSDLWEELPPLSEGIAEGNSITYANFCVYALDGKGNFWRYIPKTFKRKGGNEAAMSRVAPFKTLALYQNQPNPFNKSTVIRWSLPFETKAKLLIYDALGRVVKSLIDKEMPAGSHLTIWDGRDDFGRQVSSGVYFYELRAEEKAIKRRLLFIKD